MSSRTYYLSGYFYNGKQLVAESGRRNKRLAARAIAYYLNSKSACSYYHTFTIAEVSASLMPFTAKDIARCGVGRFRFILY